MAIIYRVKEGEPPECIISQKSILIDEFVDKEESIEFEFFGQYFPVIEEDSIQLQMDRKVVIKVVENDPPHPVFDKRGYYLLTDFRQDP